MSGPMLQEGATITYAKIEYIVPFNEIHVEVTPLFAEELLASLTASDIAGRSGPLGVPPHIVQVKRGIGDLIRKARFDYLASAEPAIRFFIKETPTK